MASSSAPEDTLGRVRVGVAVNCSCVALVETPFYPHHHSYHHSHHHSYHHSYHHPHHHSYHHSHHHSHHDKIMIIPDLITIIITMINYNKVLTWILVIIITTTIVIIIVIITVIFTWTLVIVPLSAVALLLSLFLTFNKIIMIVIISSNVSCSIPHPTQIQLFIHPSDPVIAYNAKSALLRNICKS